jgi:hypothetical protein
MRENANKSHHLLYLWQQEKKTQTFPYCNYGSKKKNELSPTTYYTYDNTKTNSY